MDLNCVICEITKKTFEVIKKVYDSQKEEKEEENEKTGRVLASLNIGSRIIFPMYCSGETRISEQELRFIFVEQFNAYIKDHKKDHKDLNNLYYSVETPTEKKYIFSKDKGGPKVDDKGVSARTDLTIYEKEGDKFTRKASIEFKALNPVIENYEKDFCKLKEEKPSLKYFIQIIKNRDKGTIDSIADKIKNKNKNNNIVYKCYCLEKETEITTEITKACE